MYGIPNGITLRQIERAAAEIERTGVAHHRNSYRFDAFVGHNSYPPKYLISLAAKYLTGSELSPENFHAHQAVRYLRQLGIRVIDRRAKRAKIIAAEDDESAFPEGREKYRLHRALERDSQIVRKAKALRLQKTGKLECDVCEHDFAERYGCIGEGFIEAHHKKPVAELDGKSRTRVADLALVCSNCHRMLHRGNLLSVEELRKIVQAHDRE